MLMFFYSVLLAVALVARTLWWIVPMLKAPQNKEERAQRFGHVPPALAAAVGGKRVVWVHAVSVGEVLAATRLVEELEAALGSGWIVVVSTTTRTGQALAQQRFGQARVFYMPLDFAFAVRPFLRALQPAVQVLIESEVWPRMMHECRRLGTPVIVANARVSDRSFARSRRVRWMWSRVLRKATLWQAQSAEDARRLVAMGAPAADVSVGGNLKYDVRAPRPSGIAELIQEAAAGRPIVVAGSTLGGTADNKLSEEERVIQAWEGALRDELKALLVIGPRHPERFKDAEMLAMKFRYAKASDWEATEGGTALEIVLLDTIGDLAAVYGVADVAFVGGSLVKRGGHNPLEPARFGVPVVMGPSYENFREIVEGMQAADGIRIVADERELGAALGELLTDRAAARALGERGRQVFERQSGATERTVAALVQLVAERGR